MQKKAYEDLVAEIQELRAHLEEAQETLDAIRRGEVDGLVVSTPKGEQVYTISGAERPYRALIEDMREGAVMLSDDNTVLYCNSGFAKMMRRSAEKIVGVKIESMVCPTYIPALIELLTLSRAHIGAVGKEVTLQAREDVLVPTLMSVNSLQSDTLKNTFLVVTDLSEHMEEEVKRYTTELELAQIALSESEQRWATTLASIGDAVIATDTSGKIKFMNGVAEELTGWTLNEASKRPVQEIFKIFNELSRKIVDDPVSKVLEKGMIVGLANHTILIRKDKTKVPIDDSAAPIKDKEGKITGVVLIFRDISERKKAEEALRISERRFKSLAENAPDVIMRFDPNLRVMYLNPQVQVATGVSAEQFVGKTNEEMGMPQELVKMWNELFHRASESKQTQHVEFDFPSPDVGRTYDLRVVPEYDENGVLTSFLGISRDITERKKAEEALKENEHLYRTVFDNSQDGFQLIELIYKNGKPFDHKFLKINLAYESIIGAKIEDILNKTARFISPNVEPHWLDIPDRVSKTGISEHVELYNKDIDKWLDCYYFLYSKNVVGTLFRDITERKKMEKQLQDSERLAAIGATAGMVGHDIRNPLQAITGDVYLAKSDLASMADCEGKQSILESLKEVEKNIDYINKIVADLQDFARPLKPNAEEADLKSIIDDLLKKNGLPENVKVSVKIETGKIVADSTFINRILYNLVNNAVQAMPKGGKLTIRTYKEANDTLISVKDTGVGIPETVKGKLFTPMFTTKSKGQGFGLAVIKRMTESLGGTVSFESQEGKGTTFKVRLPPPS